MDIHVILRVYIGMGFVATLYGDVAGRSGKLHPVRRGQPALIIRESKVVVLLVIHDVEIAHLIVCIGAEGGKKMKETIKRGGQFG